MKGRLGAALAAMAMVGSPIGSQGGDSPVPAGVPPVPRFARKGRKQKPWQRDSDHTPRHRPVYGRLKHPGQTTGPACAKCKVAVKRVRRRIDGEGPKVKITECPRCKAWGLAATVT